MAVAVKHNYQDYDPRQRLTGAVVLILFAIVLLPMLLSKNPESQVTEQTEPVVMEVTKEGKDVFVSRISSTTAGSSENDPHSGVPAKKEASKTSNVEPSSALFRPMQRPKAKADTPAKSTAKAPVKKAVAKKPEKKQAAVKKAKPVPVTGWIVQVGVFSQSANASKKVSELKKKGFTARSGKTKTSKGTIVTRVWIGPFNDRKSAEKMQERLQHKTRQRGIVVKK